MDKKRDKFAKLRSKKCSKINADAPQITNFFNPKISSSVSGTIACEVLSQHQPSQECERNGVENAPDSFIEIDDDSSSERQLIATKKIRKRGKTVEKKGPKSKVKKVDDDRFLNEMLVYQSVADNINPDDLQLALALSRSITDTHGECSTVTTEDDSSNPAKSTAKFTLEEYGFKSTAQYNRSVILGLEKELKGFRKMSPLLHRNPKKQERLFNEKINELLEKSAHELEFRRKPTPPYHFLVTSENLLKCLNTGDGIMTLNSNPDPSSEVYTCYFTGNLVEPSHAKITSMLRDWDAIPGRETSPNRASRMQIEEQNPALPEASEGLGFEPSRRSITPDILRSDGDSTLKSATREGISIELSSDEELPETPEKPADLNESEDEPLASTSYLRKTESKNFLEVEDKMLGESVIVIESDEEKEIDQSISKMIEDHHETRHLTKSVSDGFILCQNRNPVKEECDLEITPEDVPLLPQININSLLTEDIIPEEPEKISQKDSEEVTFVSQSLRNRDICVLKKRGVTPPPDYDAMDEEDIQEELKKYGLKAIKGRKAKTLLEHIYNQLHPFIQVEDEMFELKCKYGLIDAEKDLMVTTQSVVAVEHVDIVCRDDFLGDVDTKKCILPRPPRRKLPTCALPLHIAFYNLLQSKKEIHERILQYQPISLETIQEHFKSLGVKYEQNDLIEFLDKTCITFQGPNSGSRTRRKASPRKCPTKQKSADDCGE